MKSEYTFVAQLRVRYEETDQMGVAYYANYLAWFEVARTEFFRSKGIVYRDLEKEHALYLPVVEAYCRYKRPVEYDDLIDLYLSVEELSRASLAFEYKIKKAGYVVAEGRTRHVFIDGKKRPVAIPENVREMFSDEKRSMKP